MFKLLPLVISDTLVFETTSSLVKVLVKNLSWRNTEGQKEPKESSQMLASLKQWIFEICIPDPKKEVEMDWHQQHFLGAKANMKTQNVFTSLPNCAAQSEIVTQNIQKYRITI